MALHILTLNKFDRAKEPGDVTRERGSHHPCDLNFQIENNYYKRNLCLLHDNF